MQVYGRPAIKKGMKKIPDDCLEEPLVMDTKEFPIFGGESVDPYYFICYEAGEDDKNCTTYSFVSGCY